ncbi:MAG: sensor domain-containing diguanylate cyclase [Bacillota bacterium]|nr:sensor domain-containing diguanylate cyclase [Bacillota bacterium]
MSRSAWARVLAWTVFVAALAGTLWALRGYRPEAGDLRLGLILFGLALVSDFLSVPVPDRGNLWFGFAISVAALFLLGVGPAMLIDGLSMGLWNVYDTWRWQRRPWYAVAFNAGQAALNVGLGALLAAAWVPGPVPGAYVWPHARMATFVAVFGIGYFVANYALVGTLLWLVHGENLLSDRRQVLFDATLTLASAIFGLMFSETYADAGLGGLLLTAVATFLPLLALARLYLVLRQTHEQLDLYHRTALALSRATGVATAFQHFSAAARRLIPAEWAALWLLSEDGERFVCEAATGAACEGRSLDPGVPWLREVLRSQSARVLTAEELVRADLPLGAQALAHGVLVAPLTSGASAFGLVMLGGGPPTGYRPGHRQQLEVLASQAAGAIHNALLYTQLTEAAQTDAMTGLYNYRYLVRRLQAELESSAASGQPVAVLFLDMDRFKSYNDHFGHQVGDELLRAAAQVIRSSVRESDVPARYAGDEFAVILPGADRRSAEEAAERIQRALAGYAFSAGERTLIRITASVGVAVSPEDGRSVDELLRIADRMMYREKGPELGQAGLP